MFKQHVKIIYNPQTGVKLDEPADPNVWRKGVEGAWLFNPWTGYLRSSIEVGKDVFGQELKDGFPYWEVLKLIRNAGSADDVLALMDEIKCPIDGPVGDDGETALMIAAYHGATDLVKSLLAAGANPRGYTEAATVMSYGARHSHIVEILKDTDAKLDASHGAAPYFFTPIMQAINIKGSYWVGGFDYSLVDDRLVSIQMLLDMGADVNLVNVFGRTAIMSAAAIGDIRFVEILLKNGAKLDVVCNDGKSAYDYARSDSIRQMVKCN